MRRLPSSRKVSSSSQEISSFTLGRSLPRRSFVRELPRRSFVRALPGRSFVRANWPNETRI